MRRALALAVVGAVGLCALDSATAQDLFDPHLVMDGFHAAFAKPRAPITGPAALVVYDEQQETAASSGTNHSQDEAAIRTLLGELAAIWNSGKKARLKELEAGWDESARRSRDRAFLAARIDDVKGADKCRMEPDTASGQV